MIDSTAEIIILGAGLAGLSAAYHSGFPLYEAGPCPGGAARSVYKDNFVFDIGIHVLHTKDPYVLDLLQRLGVKLVTHQRRASIYSHQKYFPYPFQVNISHLPWKVRLKCLAGYFWRNHQKPPTNYEEWMVRTFGTGFSSTFLIPYAQKFWRVPPREMTFEWTDARVPVPSWLDVALGAFHDRKTPMGPNAMFHYPGESGYGYAGIARAFADKIPTIQYHMRATAIDPHSRVISFNHDGTSVPYSKLISSIPLPELLKILPEPPQAIEAHMQSLAWNSIAVVNLGINRPHISDKHWVHFPEESISFFRISFPSNFCEGLTPSGASSIQAEVTYDFPNPPNEEELVRRVVADLIKVGVLQAGDGTIFQNVIYQPYAYVVYNHPRRDSVAAIHQYLKELDIYPCGRYGAWEYFWTDEAIWSGKRAVEQFL